MILVENWAPLVYDPCSPHNSLVAVGYWLPPKCSMTTLHAGDQTALLYWCKEQPK